MSFTPSVETLDFAYPGSRPVGTLPAVLVGVVGSGNLEVLAEPVAGDQLRVHVETSARGFGAIWRAVIDDFAGRHALAGLQVSIHDMGATPAVVSLRLDQAVSELLAGGRS